MNLKRNLIKALAIFIRFGVKCGDFFWRLTKFAAKPLQKLGSGGFRFVFFPVYKLFYVIKYKVLNVYAPARSKLFYLLNKSYLVHVFLVIIGLIVFSGNINAQEIRDENFGEKTGIYAIVSKEEYEELSEETQVVLGQDQIFSYLDKTGNVETQKMLETENTEADEQLLSQLSGITQGGTAIMKPNILQPISIDEMPEVASQRRISVVQYKVLPGETISAIAQKFGVSVETILWQNNLTSRSLIRPGDSLEILPVSGVSHKIVRGETVGGISKKYGVDANDIIKANNLLDASDIQISQVLLIPGGKKQVTYVATRSGATVPAVSSITKLFIPPAADVVSGEMYWPAAVRYISQYYKITHRGLDIAGPSGTAVYASDDGVVEFSGWSNSGYGYNILINHGNGIKTRYAHASKLYVSKGATVVKGQTIMAMGTTGRSTGNHLHFEVIQNGVLRNPLSYIR
ncbi:M23 family metallopeptidase [Patescibacteria group bacterium]|nr:M23 family metallopeptidase [Patescibacteria group bacterium]